MRIKNLKIIAIFFIIAIVSCQSETKKNDNNKVEKQSTTNVDNSTNLKIQAASEGKSMNINKNQFINNIYDFEKNKDWTYKSDLPCVIDFYADWCKPCKMIAPYLDELAIEYKGKVHFLKVNVDVEEELSKQFNIGSIPAIMYCPMNGKPQMNIGGMPKAEIRKNIEQIIFSKK